MSFIQNGGLWKNSEDEILKAAVMKYGLNNWSRVASLLIMKSAKQCKSRWYEWLDPRVKKTEWSKAEEEKLLHLARLFPCQWRTIAPLVGRTAHQCLEHYELLLDRATGQQIPKELDPRLLRPGEIDPNPEAKPSKPDTVDMDEEEVEMLAEARARLANTNGRKAKRKARERYLEETRRIAMLQKRRELKAAGMLSHASIMRYRKKKYKGVDYLNEIPFEEVPEEGAFKMDKDSKKTEKKLSYAELEGLNIKSNKKNEKPQTCRKEGDAKKSVDFKFEEPNRIVIKKRKLDLPKPQLTLNDVKIISNMNFEIENDSESISKHSESTTMPSKVLNTISKSQRSTILEESRAILNEISQPSPFNPIEMDKFTISNNETNKGLQNEKLSREVNFSQISNKIKNLNDLGSIKSNISSILGYRTLSDRFSLNSGSVIGDQGSISSMDPIGRKARFEMYKMQAKTLLYDLPPAKNKVQVDLDSLNNQLLEMKKRFRERENSRKIDQMDIQRKNLIKEEEKKKLEWEKETQVIKLGLPRPYLLKKNIFSKMDQEEDDNSLSIDKDSHNKQIRELIQKEMIYLFYKDMRNHPQQIPEFILDLYGAELFQNMTNNFSKLEDTNLSDFDESITIKELENASKLINDEINQLISDPTNCNLNKNLEDIISNPIYDPKYIYVPYMKEFMLLKELSESHKEAAFKNMLFHLNLENDKVLQENSQIICELEDNLSIPISESLALEKEIFEIIASNNELKADINALMLLQKQDQTSYLNRIKYIEQLIDQEKSLNKSLQNFFYRLTIS